MHGWRIEAHLLTRTSPLSDYDAAEWHGRSVSITRTGYTTPWQGTCEESGRARRARPLAEVAAELGVERARLPAAGFTDPLVEYKLSCQDPVRRAPTLTLYVSGARGLTCFGGACYVLAR